MNKSELREKLSSDVEMFLNAGGSVSREKPAKAKGVRVGRNTYALYKKQRVSKLLENVRYYE